MIKRVDRYIGRVAALGIVFVWFSMTLLLMMFTLLGELRDSTAGYDTSDVLWYVLQTGPRTAYEVFPISALLGSLLGIGALAGANELVAFRTSGVSRLRLAAAGLAGVLLFTIPVMGIGEWIVPGIEQQARAFRISQLAGQLIIGGPTGMWMRDGDEIVNIRRPLMTVGRSGQSISFQDIEIYAFGPSEKLQQVTRARRAYFDDERWTLEGVAEVDIGPDRVTTSRLKQRPWHTSVKPGLLASAVSRPSYLSLRVLWEQLHYLERNGLDDSLYLSAFWEKIVYPLTVVALVLAGMPLVFGSARFMNLGMRLFAGMALGGVFLLINGTAQNLAAAYSLPIALSTVTPSFLLAALAVLSLRRSI
jgi:lipopolysaccharide export system permease protein